MQINLFIFKIIINQIPTILFFYIIYLISIFFLLFYHLVLIFFINVLGLLLLYFIIKEPYNFIINIIIISKNYS